MKLTKIVDKQTNKQFNFKTSESKERFAQTSLDKMVEARTPTKMWNGWFSYGAAEEEKEGEKSVLRCSCGQDGGDAMPRPPCPE